MTNLIIENICKAILILLLSHFTGLLLDIFHTNMDPEEEEIRKINLRGRILKSEIAKNRSKRIKLKIEYNSLSSHIGENLVELSSYLGTITRTHVPIIVESWRKVPKDTKEKLWDLIMVSLSIAFIYNYCIHSLT